MARMIIGQRLLCDEERDRDLASRLTLYIQDLKLRSFPADNSDFDDGDKVDVVMYTMLGIS